MYYENFGEDGEYLGRKYVSKKEYEEGIGLETSELILEPGDEDYEPDEEEEEEEE